MERAFAETIVFVPFFGGKMPSFRRHMEFVESLGYSSVFVPLEFSLLKVSAKPFSARTGDFGMKALWADQIEKALNSIPGRKIIFAFSNPSAGAIEAIARRHAHDIAGLICDSGPTSEIWKSVLNYFKEENLLPTLPLKLIGTTYYTYLLTPRPSAFCFQDLQNIPAHFPILSIRGWKDPLISPKQIDQIFEPHPHLQWQKLSLPQAGHVNGLKDFPNEYRTAVSEFLRGLSTPITSPQPTNPHP